MAHQPGTGRVGEQHALAVVNQHGVAAGGHQLAFVAFYLGGQRHGLVALVQQAEHAHQGGQRIALGLAPVICTVTVRHAQQSCPLTGHAQHRQRRSLKAVLTIKKRRQHEYLAHAFRLLQQPVAQGRDGLAERHARFTHRAAAQAAIEG